MSQPTPPLRRVPGGQSRRGWHDLQNWLKCPHLAVQKRVRKREPPSSEPLVRGILLHEGLAHMYAQRTVRPGEVDFVPWVDAVLHCAEAGAETDPFNAHMWNMWAQVVLEAITAYGRYYAYDEYEEVIAVEHELEHIFYVDDTPELYTQRADLMVRRNGKLIIVDHKGASQISEAARARTAASGQIAGYHELGKLTFGEDFGGVEANFIGFAKKRGSSQYTFSFHRYPMMGPDPGEFEKLFNHACRIRRAYEARPDFAPKVMVDTQCHGFRACDFYADCWTKGL